MLSNVQVDTATTTAAAPFTVDVTPTADGDGDVTFVIVWGDDTPDSNVAAGDTEPHTYQRPGQYTIVATATDDDDSADADPLVITVSAPEAFPMLDNDGGVCVPWLNIDDVCNGGETTQDRRFFQAAINTATRWLNDATANRWSGPCTTFIRPFADDVCSPRQHTSIDLSTWVSPPVRRIIQIRVDGVEIDLSWAYLSGNRLVPSTGWGDDESPMIPWPTQNPDRQPGGVGTWDLTVLHGAGPPEPLVDATHRLASAIVKQCCGAEDCELPDNVASVARDGVTITFKPPAPGECGIPFVDAQIALYGPQGKARRRRMYDPDGPTAQVGRY